jgi:hypothetical protein
MKEFKILVDYSSTQDGKDNFEAHILGTHWELRENVLVIYNYANEVARFRYWFSVMPAELKIL